MPVYFVSGMLQAFVPKKELLKYMGRAGFKNVAFSTFFVAVSSSCPFAALAAARSPVTKGAHFVTAVVFMFISNSPVIEQGILLIIVL